MVEYTFESIHDRVVASRLKPFTEYIRREVMLMTAYEIITIFLSILTCVFTFGSLIVALLAFLDKRNKRK